MRISRVKIENFKRFESLDVALLPLDCLVGTNNSGKTTLLQALALFDFCVHHCLSRRNGHIQLEKRTIAPEDFYVLPVKDPMDLWHDRRAMSNRKQRRIRVTVTFDTDETVSATIKLDYNRFGVSVEVEQQSQELFQRLVEFKMAYLPVFSMFLPREERRLSAAIEDELIRGRVHAVVRNLLLELKNKNRLDLLTAILRRSFPSLRDLSIQFDDVSDRYIDVQYTEHGHPKEFDIFSAGSGFQQFLYLFGFILLRDPAIILLDEPDVHLHGTLQAVLLDELRQLVADGKQVLFATHSRDLITRVGPENVLSLESGGARRLRVAYDVYDTLDQLGSLDPTQLAMVQAYRRVVVVEDRTDQELIGILCAKVVGTDVWQQAQRRLAFCYSKGNPWKQQDISRLRAMLQQMIAVDGPALELFVIADRDYQPDLAKLLAILPTDHIKWHIWERTEIENYLLCAPAIKRMIGDTTKQPTLDGYAFQTEFDRLVESCRATASDKLVQAYDEWRKRSKEVYDASTMSRMAREYLVQYWEGNKLGLADAKDVVLPGIKKWLQSRQLGQFSDRRLADNLEPSELPREVHDLARQLIHFAGLGSTEDSADSEAMS